MNLKGIQKQQLLAALGACLAAMILAGPAAAKPNAGIPMESQRHLELASDRYFAASESGSSSTQRSTPDGYQPQLGGAESTASLGSLRDRPDGYQPQLGVSELAVVADDGFEWTNIGFAASLIAAMLVVAATTFTYGNRRGYRSA
ncbi:MAG: hypothetical protein ACR2GT_05225 [Gaiellaceae bacterium]